MSLWVKFFSQLIDFHKPGRSTLRNIPRNHKGGEGDERGEITA